MARHSPALLLVHIVWATSRRRPSLTPAFDSRLAAILGAKARSVGSCLLVTGCANDHVHAVLRIAPSVALADVVQRLKGASAHDANHRSLLPERLVWQVGYWAESLGPANLAPLARYVRRQREHHDDFHPAERWQLGDDCEPASGGRL